MTTNAIRLSPEDNVATVLRAVRAAECLRVRCDGSVTEIEAREIIPLCRKISMSSIEGGSAVMKYGQTIGEALEPIAAGRHVHVHTVRSARARMTS